MTVLPMFPLSSVLFPTMILPLHVFEPRYRALVHDCISHDPREFGVVLIERGSEVGGEDIRSDLGTVARILQAEELDDGRWVVAAVGVRRLRVRAWLSDDPYPRGEVDDWPDDAPDDGADGSSDPDLAEQYARQVRLLRRVLALKTELGEAAAPSTIELADDPAVGAMQIGAVGPFGPADQQRVLAAGTVGDRLAIISRLLQEEVEYLQQRMALG